MGRNIVHTKTNSKYVCGITCAYVKFSFLSSLFCTYILQCIQKNAYKIYLAIINIVAKQVVHFLSLWENFPSLSKAL